jgi:Glycosyltransferase
MKFLFLANTRPNPDEGASGCDLATIRALRELGHEVDDIWLGEHRRRIRHNNLHQLCELPFLFRDAMLERFRNGIYDVVQISQPHGYLAAKTHRALKLPGVFIIRSHGWEPRAWAEVKRHGFDRRPAWRRAATVGLRMFLARHNQRSLRYADGIVVCSRDDAASLSRDVEPEQLLALSPGVPSYFLSVPPEFAPERFRRVLFAGSYSAHKAPEVVAGVMRALAASDRMTDLTWVTQDSAHDDVRRLLGPAAERVRLRGWMPRQELLELYDSHGFFLQPSHYEGYCMAFLEAMARGCCVLATNISGPGEKIVHGRNGFLFDRGDAEGIARTILDLTEHPDLCGSISREARRTAAVMTWEATARRFSRFCEGLLERKMAGIICRP